ncbi:phosphoribosylaminoimidazolesuccinocarboxamide synthase [Domibacillus epiphyticus]|uniref:Phosphoribosylaminoimidazole-succinocarboxamide synthase n=1 Tax=Domibacillus epiphyticus TaxID=1714355 RepID=A0A1V2AB29_9BACI|nr:phosphoribosylaminoimidazolesuccinocarboxamide synthase [Domibacillus epiphyticus]OMP68004.1 phosphoribosylaminoimidazolesuccinocarboxamide synthase [Domibacillus epiphyticus]
MNKGKQLYEGKAKRIYATDQEDIVWIEYKNSATAFNGEKKAEIDGKGRLNNLITGLLFKKLAEHGIESHFVEQLSENEQLVKHVNIIPLEVVVRNAAAGSIAKRLGFEEGTPFKEPIVEFYYKDDALGDPLLTEDHIKILEAATPEEVQFLKKEALRVNEVLVPLFSDMDIELIDFKIELGKDKNGSILLADEISPDTCRLWEKGTKRKLDKDLFRRDLGGLTEAYTEIYNRLGGTL